MPAGLRSFELSCNGDRRFLPTVLGTQFRVLPDARLEDGFEAL